MSLHHYLRPLLAPASVALVGASERAGSLGRIVFENLLDGEFAGDLHAINPNHRRVLGGQDTVKATLEESYKQVALMESGLLTSRTDALGGAEIQGLVKDMAVSKGMVFRRSDLLPVKNISPEYSKISTRIEVHGNIHQLVDFLVSLGSSPTILFVEEMRISPAQMGDLKNKQVVSTLLISGLKTPDKGNSASDKKS